MRESAIIRCFEKHSHLVQGFMVSRNQFSELKASINSCFAVCVPNERMEQSIACCFFPPFLKWVVINVKHTIEHSTRITPGCLSIGVQYQNCTHGMYSFYESRCSNGGLFQLQKLYPVRNWEYLPLCILFIGLCLSRYRAVNMQQSPRSLRHRSVVCMQEDEDTDEIFFCPIQRRASRIRVSVLQS
jgi:hypothetical protein